MKAILYSVVIALFIAITIVSCEKTESSQSGLSGEVIYSSSCKDGNSSNQKITETADTLSCVEYTYDNDQNKLFLKHINTGFNCCPGELTCRVELVGDTIVIREFEEYAMCNCNCLFDIDIKIDGITPDSYYIKFIEPYYSGPAKLEFSIDLSEVSSDTYCVTRIGYPWGMP